MAEQKKSKYQDLYAPGYYEAEVIDNTFTQPKLENGQPDPNKTPYLVVKVKVLSMKKTAKGGPIPEQIMDGHRYVNVFFTEKTIEATREFLKQAGFKGADIRVLSLTTPEGKPNPNHVSLKGFKFEVRCENEKMEFGVNKGKLRDKFSHAVNAKSNWSESFTTASNSKLMGLNALWNVNAGAKPAAKHVAEAKQEEQEPFAPVSDNDAPPPVEDWD